MSIGTQVFEIKFGRIVSAHDIDATRGYALDIHPGANAIYGWQANASKWFEPWTLDRVMSISHFLLPQATLWVAPKWCDRHGKTYLLGQASLIADTILVSSHTPMAQTLSTLFHEIWHSAELWLSVEERDAVTALVGENGIDWPDRDGDGYYTSLIERRARAFEYFAMARLEGVGRQRAKRKQIAYRAFERVLSGDVAASICRRGFVPEAHWPEHVRQSVAARGATMSIVDRIRDRFAPMPGDLGLKSARLLSVA